MGCSGIEANCEDLRGLSKKEREKRLLEREKRLRAKTNEVLEQDAEFKIRRILIAPLVFLQMAGLSENQSKIIYASLIGVGGYFIYKKFK